MHTVIDARRTTRDYLSGAEELRRKELVWGVVRGDQPVRSGVLTGFQPRASAFFE